MPKINGLEFVKSVHALDFKGRILVLSGRLSASECRSYLGYAVSGFLHKPFEISMVITMLCKPTNEGTGKAAPKLVILGRSQDEGNARANAGKTPPSPDGDQREPAFLAF